MNLRNELLEALSIQGSWIIDSYRTTDGEVFKSGPDTKGISVHFEDMCKKHIERVTAKFGFTVEKGPQNRYPDYTLIKSNCHKIAIDIKTTYIRPNGSIRFTLGTFKLGKKGCVYSIEEYGEHWVIGFVYNRTPNGPHSYANVEYFVQEKHRIAATAKSGLSGNTRNLFSITSKNLQDFVDGNGPFSTYQWFHTHWLNNHPHLKGN